MSHFLDIHTTPQDELRAMIDQARAMKNARQGLPKGTPDAEQPLAGRMIALIFEKPSTRTRISFDVGARQMGGQTMVLSGKDMQLGHGESISDTARVLSRYVDLSVLCISDEATPKWLNIPSLPRNCRSMHASCQDCRARRLRGHREAGRQVRVVGRRQQRLHLLAPCGGPSARPDLYRTRMLDPEARRRSSSRGRAARVDIARHDRWRTVRMRSSPIPGFRCTTPKARANGATISCAPTRSTAA